MLDYVIPILQWFLDQLEQIPEALLAIARALQAMVGPYAPGAMEDDLLLYVTQSWNYLLAALLLGAVAFATVVTPRWKAREPVVAGLLQTAAGALATALLMPWQANLLDFGVYAGLGVARTGGLIVCGLTALRGLDILRRGHPAGPI